MSRQLLNYLYSLKLLTGLAGVLAASFLIPLPAFSQSVSLGAYATPDNTIIIPSDTFTSFGIQQTTIPGGTVVSRGFVANPNGTLTSSNGTIITPDGSIVTPNGWISAPSGTLVSPNGWVSNINNRTLTSPEGRVTRLGSL